MHAEATVPSGGRRVLRPGWPLTFVFVGYPLWWALGLSPFMWPIVAFPMLLSLLRRSRITVPPGFLVWVAFLVWMLLSGFRLDDAGRGLGFAFRALLYLSATVLLLYVFNSSPTSPERRRVLTSVTVFWIYVVIGGFLGLLFPSFSFASPVERILPGTILQNDFVRELVHPAFAQVQTFLGDPTARPSAPFVYTNDWGAAVALLAPLVVLSWGVVSRRVRMAVVVAGVAAVVPIVASLNRGLWVALLVAGLYTGLRLTLRGRERAAWILMAGGIAVAIAVAATPLRSAIDERLATPHSNERRASLYDEALEGVAESPWFGYGAPRPSERNSDAPSVGTQGHFWLVLFSHGVPGAALFLAWFGFAFWRFRHGETAAALCCHVVLLVMFVLLPVYGMLPMQLHLVMLAMALAYRERRTHVQALRLAVPVRQPAPEPAR